MDRLIAGHRLPIKCLLINGVYVGSCVYEDLCETARLLTQKPETKFVFTSLLKSFFVFKGDEILCPVKSLTQSVNFVEKIHVPDFSKTPLSLFMVGDYDIKIELTDEEGNVGCWNFLYTMKK